MYETIIALIVRQFQIEEDYVDENTNFADDLGADSMDMVELIAAVEDSLDLEIPDEDVPDICTVRDLCEYVERADF